MKLAPSAPGEYLWFSMGRLLLILDEIHSCGNSKIESDKLMLIDFAVQHPREMVHLIPDIYLTLAAEGLMENDFSDFFVKFVSSWAPYVQQRLMCT